MMDQRILFVLLNVRSMLCQIRRGLTKDVEYETDTSKKKSQFKARNGLRLKDLNLVFTFQKHSLY